MPEFRLIAFCVAHGSLSSTFIYPTACAPFLLADAFSLRFCSLGGMQVLLCVWAGETQLLSFSTVLVHVCHLSHGLIRIVFVAHR